jgi:hypothetical protein
MAQRFYNPPPPSSIGDNHQPRAIADECAALTRQLGQDESCSARGGTTSAFWPYNDRIGSLVRSLKSSGVMPSK